MLIQVRWGHFSTKLSLINVEKESFAHSCKSSCGGFATVYFEEGKNDFSVAKCLKFVRFNSKKEALYFAIKEYFLNVIASALGVGPMLTKILGFDIVVYNSCI